MGNKLDLRSDCLESGRCKAVLTTNLDDIITFYSTSGTDVIHAAIEKLENSNQTNWESVTMEIHVSTINLIKTAVSN